jgi:Kef-type K+ transport system membrane component KefB
MARYCKPPWAASEFSRNWKTIPYHASAEPRTRRWLRLLLALAVLTLPLALYAAEGSGHSDPIAPVIFGVTGILFFAIVGRFTARELNMPAVLGELVMGILLGNLAYLLHFDVILFLREGPQIFDMLSLSMMQGESISSATHAIFPPDIAGRLLPLLLGPRGSELLQVAHTVDVFSRYGVIFLLFLVGLESSIEEMRKVGPDSVRTAIIGVVLPFGLGYVAANLLIPDAPAHTHMFIGATLSATSVGITARVLRELGRSHSAEGHIILGAAVMDDVLGLLILAIVSGIVVSGGVDLINIATIIALASLFLLGAIYAGPYLLKHGIRLLSGLDMVEAKMFVSFLFVMVLAWLANLVGLAAIVGAFTAGLILHDGYFEGVGKTQTTVTIKDLIMPLEVVLVPIFFVLMGVQVKLEAFFDPKVLLLALGLLAAAILGKVLCGFGAGRSNNRWAIGIGMMPRGEVGLIFASIGKSLGVITDALFSAVVLMVLITTLLAPPLLKLTMGPGPGQRETGATG